VLAAISIPGICLADAKPEIHGPAGRVGYSLGHQIGEDLKRQSVDVDADAMLRGLRDALGGADSSIPEDEMGALLVGLKQKIGASEKKGQRGEAERHRAEGSEFLAAMRPDRAWCRCRAACNTRCFERARGSVPVRTTG